MQIYFAHPQTTYGTPAEKQAMSDIQQITGCKQIMNPAEPVAMPAGTDVYRAAVEQAEIVVFMASDVDVIGKGTYTNIMQAADLDRLVLFYKDGGLYRGGKLSLLPHDDWVSYAKVTDYGKMVNQSWRVKTMDWLDRLNSSLTRLRTSLERR